MRDAAATTVTEQEPHPDVERTLPGTRIWFAFFSLWMIGWAVVALAAFHSAEQGVPSAWRLWVLALMCFYISLCNGFAPMPTAWIVLLAASPDFALVETPALRIAVVAALATSATVVANLNEYHLLSYLLRFGLGRWVRRTKVYNWAVQWFDRAPFQLLTLIAFVPIPIDAVRWLATLRGYSRVRLALAYAIGRGPRYALFAWLAVMLRFEGWQIVAVQLGLIAVAVVGRIAWHIAGGSRRAGRKKAAESEAITVAAAAEASEVAESAFTEYPAAAQRPPAVSTPPVSDLSNP